MAEGTLANGEFEGRVVGSLTGKFFVPGYQRGYRWGEQEVRRLLEDIQASGDQTYYLQPIVVKARADGRWELVDGQQRLTTLFLILQYMKQFGIRVETKYSLEYDTRPRSAEFLELPTAELAQDNIDFSHMYRAWKCIEAWFETQDDQVLAAINLYKALAERVKVIWYEAPSSTDSTELFRRLNVGKIPLTDAELVKALVLSRADKPEAMAAEWDAIERELRLPELWAFITRRSQSEATHIMLLLDMLADTPSAGWREPFQTFETLRPRIVLDADGFWNSVVDLHSLVMGWYEDRDLFHKIGYLVAVGLPLSAILKLADRARKSEFVSRLDARIRERLRLSNEDLRDLSYDSSGPKLSEVLLLMNVETVRKVQQSSERYSFRAHASGNWSLEHIHAQNSVPLNSVEQWAQWLRLHRDALESLPHVGDSQRSDLRKRIDDAIPEITEERFRELEQELGRVFSPDGVEADDVHSISNLALLDSRDNSALSNAMFEVKRLAVIERDRSGSYIPASTRNVFLKYYTGERAQQVHFWSRQDREAYLAAIEAQLDPYLVEGELE